MNRRARVAAIFLGLMMVAVPALAATPLVTDDLSTRTRYIWPGDPSGLPGTTAIVDTVLREIRLPKASAAGASIIDARPDGWGIVTANGNQVESYGFNGQSFVRNDVLTVLPTETVAGVAGRGNSTDVVALGRNSATHYSFNGADMQQNPFLNVAGLTAPVQVVTRPGGSEVAVLDGTSVKTYASTGTSMVNVPALSLMSGLSNPVAVALHPQTYDTVVIDGGEARYFNWNGSALVHNPMLSVTGITNPIAVQVGGNSTVYVGNASGVTAYGFNGQQMAVNSFLSVSNAAGAFGFALLGDGTTLAIRYPEEIRVYQFDGQKMIENQALRITGLTFATNGNQKNAVAVSQVFPVSAPVEALVINARTSVPAGTAVTFEVSSDRGASWKQARPGRGIPIVPVSSAGAMWRAFLSGTREVTPKVLPDIKLEQVWIPRVINPRVLEKDPDGLVRTATPKLAWDFADKDLPQDQQSAFQIVLQDEDTGKILYNTGKVSTMDDADPPPTEGGDTPLTLRDPRGKLSQLQLPLGTLSEGYRYQWKVRIWDKYDLMSEWSSWNTFEVLALYNVTITDVVHPPDGSPKPPTQAFPVPVKAGALFTFLVDSIGAIHDVEVRFSDGGQRPASARSPIEPSPPVRNTWDSGYFTDPHLPSGTILHATISGRRKDGRSTSLDVDLVAISGSIYDDFTVILTK